MNAPNVVDRYTLDLLDAGVCYRCREIVVPEVRDDTEVCPFCSSEVFEYGSVIDAVCDPRLGILFA